MYKVKVFHTYNDDVNDDDRDDNTTGVMAIPWLFFFLLKTAELKNKSGFRNYGELGT